MKHMKNLTRSLIVPLLAAGLAGCGAQPPAAKPASAVPVAVTTAPAALMDHATLTVLPGTVQAATAATIMARVPGIVTRIAVAPGTAVAAGALLVELDAQEILAKRDQAQAAVAMAQAAVAEANAAAAEANAAHRLADLELTRAKTLLAKEALTRAEYDGAEAKASATTARVAATTAMITAATRRVGAAEAAASEAAVMVGYLRLTAPFAGIVVRKHVAVGDLLAPGRPVIELEDPAAMRLEVAVPESLASRITVGANMRVHIDAAGLDHDAAVVEIIPAADPVSRTVLAKLALPADSATLRSGQFGRVAVTTAPGQVLAVPATAVVRRGQLDAVFVVTDSVARLRLVRTGGVDGERIIIRAGLAAGDRVVTAPSATLTDGQPVQ